MVLPIAALIPAALGIAEVALPSLARWIAPGDDKAETIARQVVGMAQTITGADTPEAAREALQVDPAATAEMRARLQEIELEAYKAETERLEIVNQTMRTEAVSSDPYVRRWRPHMGYWLTYTWVVVMVGIVAAVIYAVVAEPAAAGQIIQTIGELLGAMTVMWSVALAVLGINVSSRSRDKQVAAGQKPVGVLDALASRLGGRPT